MCWFPTPQVPNKSFLEADILLIQKVKEKKRKMKMTTRSETKRDTQKERER